MKIREFEALPEHLKDAVFCMWAQSEFQGDIQAANDLFEHIRRTNCPDCMAEITRRFAIYVALNVEMQDVSKHVNN